MFGYLTFGLLGVANLLVGNVVLAGGCFLVASGYAVTAKVGDED